jgi:hypothetical protein
MKMTTMGRKILVALFIIISPHKLALHRIHCLQ